MTVYEICDSRGEQENIRIISSILSFETKAYISLYHMLLRVDIIHADCEQSIENFLKDYSCFVLQAMSFFKINPFDDKEDATKKIFRFIAGKKMADLNLLCDTFDPADMIAVTAILFQNIREMNLNKKQFASDDFSQALRLRAENMSIYVQENCPRMCEVFELFINKFKFRYLSPWNPDRFKSRRGKADFGTRIDLMKD